jgi:hypothetical protein
MICQSCGIEADTRKVAFHRNIGALVVRFHKSIKGEMCKSCVNKYFWEYTAVNVTVGWLGIVSLVLAPVFTINNIVHYIPSLSMPPVPSGAKRPVLDERAMSALRPRTDAIVQRIKAGEPFEQIAADVAATSGVTPGQVTLYMRAMLAAARKK